MRHTLPVVAVLALMVPTTGRADDADAKAEVAKLTRQASESLVKGDTTTLDTILADDWVVIGPDGQVGTKDSQAKDLKEEATDFVAMDASEVKVRVYGDAAVVTGRYQVKVKMRGQERGGPVRRTDFFAKVGGKWRCVSTQVTHIASQSGEDR